MLKELVAAAKAPRKRLYAGLEAVLFATVLALLALVMLQVFTRYVMQVALPWTEEVARMVLVWMVMLGATISAERNEHYAITFLSQRLKGAGRLAVLIATNLCGLVFVAALIVFGTQYVLANLHTVYVSTQSTKAFVYVALPACAVLMALSLLMQSLEAWTTGVDSVLPQGVITGDV